MKILNWFLTLFGLESLIRPVPKTIETKTFKELKGDVDRKLDLASERLNAGMIARDLGIQQATDSANKANRGWSDVAYGFLLGYAKSHSEFMIEDLRTASVGFVPEPPSNRAWGGIAVRAVKGGIITRKGFQNVKNVKAHRTPATLWEVNK